MLESQLTICHIDHTTQENLCSVFNEKSASQCLQNAVVTVYCHEDTNHIKYTLWAGT